MSPGTPFISPHGDKNVIEDWEKVRLTVRKSYTRYGVNGTASKPFRGFEVVVALRRKILVGTE